MDFSVTQGSYGFSPAYTPPRKSVPAPLREPVLETRLDRIPARTITVGGGTRLVNEQRVDLSDGYRLARTFEREDGRIFTKLEELSLTDRGARRIIIQQNPSGSLTHYEEVLDRDDSGTFRRTQRFQEGDGEVATAITPDYNVTDPFILTGGLSPNLPSLYNPFARTRGTQLDLRA